MSRRAVLIHKTPSSWQKRENFSKEELPDMASLEALLSPLHSAEIPEGITGTDIYTSLLEEITRTLGLDELHIVQGFDPGEKRNWQSAGRPGKARLNERTVFYCVDDPAHLCAFLDARLLFTRGRYPILHRELQRHRCSGVWMHYPATSNYFPHFDRFIQTWRHSLTAHWSENRKKFLSVLRAMLTEHGLQLGWLETDGVFDPERLRSPDDLQPIFEALDKLRLRRRPKQKDCPYQLVLCDDVASVTEVKRMYPGAKATPFIKPALDRKSRIELERTWDLAFCGTSLQSTKNHTLFVGLLEQLDKLTKNTLRVAVLGNRGDVAGYQQALDQTYQNIEITDIGEVSRDEALVVFGRSRALLITSGRDCNPRVIAEAALHGARIIVLDLLSDGLEVIAANPLLGAVITSNSHDWRYARNGNLAISATAEIAGSILDELDESSDPQATVEYAKRVFDLTTCAEMLSAEIVRVSGQ